MNTLSARLQAIHDRIDEAKHNVGRNDTVNLCAVSKTQSAEIVRSAYEAGQTIFGENYVQEAVSKQSLLKDCAIEWHFIGPIQSNKTQLIAQHFEWVHSVDRIKIANRLSEARGNDKAPLNVCLQVNISHEDTKSGINLNDITPLAAEIVALPNLTLRGLMAIPAPITSTDLQHRQYQTIKQAFESLIKQGFVLDTLSIGMSDDFEIAIAEGATIVRIGSAIFGQRKPKSTENI
jgi:PLP dependent protein